MKTFEKVFLIYQILFSIIAGLLFGFMTLVCWGLILFLVATTPQEQLFTLKIAAILLMALGVTLLFWIPFTKLFIAYFKRWKAHKVNPDSTALSLWKGTFWFHFIFAVICFFSWITNGYPYYSPLQKFPILFFLLMTCWGSCKLWFYQKRIPKK